MSENHFTSIRNFFFFLKFLTKWLTSAILDVRNSLSIAFLAISDRSAILDFRNSLSIAILVDTEFVFRQPFWMSENHFGSHFWPFQIDRPFWMSEIHFRWHFWPFQIHNLTKWPLFSFWMSANNFRSHFWPFQIDTQLFFNFFWTKWPPAAILDRTTMSIIELVRDICLNPSKVIALTKL